MNPKNERLIHALGGIDEKYIKETESKVKKGTIIKSAIAACLVLALGLYLFIPFVEPSSNLKDYESSAYFPLIEKIEDYRLSFKKSPYKNYFEYYIDLLDNLSFGPTKGDIGMDMAPPPGAAMPDGSNGMENTLLGNGNYVESTDNQVEGVIESDLMKMTDKYIFRVGLRHQPIDEVKGKWVEVLRVYSIDKEDSTLISEYEIPRYDEENYLAVNEMYLSSDGNTVTLLKEHSSSLHLVSVDVSDVTNITEKGHISIEGDLNTSRMVDGKLLLVTNYSFARNSVDYADPETFVPTIDAGDGAKPIEFQDIIYPEEVSSTSYSVVALLDTENLTLLGANALLNFTNDVYVSENNLYLTREYTKKTDTEDGYKTSATTDIAVLNYTGETLEKRGVITVRGHAEDQYSFDEREGYLRVVTSTSGGISQTDGQNVTFMPENQNVSLYIYDLADNSLAYKVEDFAIDGEEATAVRFDGDMLYVCTAVKVSFTDPVYFIDLSDYENISSIDTGVIEGFSEHLINYGEGLLLGIGQESWMENKVEIYEEKDGIVKGTFEFKFDGTYSIDYKAYLVNRENNLFGFGVDYYTEYNEETNKYKYYQAYILIQFDGAEMNVAIFNVDDLDANTVRAAYVDGYLYITTSYDLVVEKIN